MNRRPKILILVALLLGGLALFIRVRGDFESARQPLSSQEADGGSVESENVADGDDAKKTAAQNAGSTLGSEEEAKDAAEIDAQEKCLAAIDAQARANGFEKSVRPKLDKMVGPWLYQARSDQPRESEPIEVGKESSVQGKFFAALAKAQLIDGMTVTKDENVSLKLLKEVSDLDRENSAPMLYRAIILQRQGRESDASALFDEAKTRLKFSDYVTDFNHALFSEVKTPLDLVEAYNLYAKMPLPNLVVLKDFLKARDSREIALKMMTVPNVDAPGGDLTWSALGYMIGESVLREKDPTHQHFSYKNILRAQLMNNPSEQINELYKSGCNVDDLQPRVDKYRNYFERAGK